MELTNQARQWTTPSPVPPPESPAPPAPSAPPRPAPTHPVAHHFRTFSQQSSAAKLGMWIFLVTEILLFSGLFCLYVVQRSSKPEIFAWGHRMLDKELGLINTLILITSSMTMVLAVRAAQLRRRRLMMAMLLATFLAGVGFLGIKGIEYNDKFQFGLLPGVHFKPNMKYVAYHFGATRKQLRELSNAHGPIPRGLKRGKPEVGKSLFAATCMACHGADGGGVPNTGANLRASRFVALRSDKDLLAFVQGGRMPTDPDSLLKLQMPARGGNPALDDQKLLHIISYIRTLQQGEHIDLSPVASVPAPVLNDGAPHSDLAPGSLGPPGLYQPPPGRPRTLDDYAPPPHQALFFSTYFLLTGLHGIHVIAGMGMILWLLLAAWRGRFDANPTAVEMGGMYWHLVDLIWILLFPLLYLA